MVKIAQKDTANSLDTSVTDPSTCLPDRNSKIAKLAYFKAEARGFEPGHELEDWVAAEQELDLADNKVDLT